MNEAGTSEREDGTLVDNPITDTAHNGGPSQHDPSTSQPTSSQGTQVADEGIVTKNVPSASMSQKTASSGSASPVLPRRQKDQVAPATLRTSAAAFRDSPDRRTALDSVGAVPRHRRVGSRTRPSDRALAESFGTPPRARPRVRAPANKLPSAFPQPARDTRRESEVGTGTGGGSQGARGHETSAIYAQVSAEAPLNHSRMSRRAGKLNNERLDDSEASDELELSVHSHQEHLTADGHRYTTYEVMVRFGGREWTVRKRYSQFDAFRNSLRKQHKEVGSFRFPNKSKFNTFSEHTKERRRTGFDEFLRLVAALHPRPQEVDVFLAMDEHGAGVQGRTGTRASAWARTNVSSMANEASDVTATAAQHEWRGHDRTAEASRVGQSSGSSRQFTGSNVNRIPRFPPLADKGRAGKAAEAAAAAAPISPPSRRGPAAIICKVDAMMRQALGPDLLSVVCVVAVSAASIVGVWKVGGTPGLATLVLAVCVGLFFQSWDRGFDLGAFVLELLGLGSDLGQEGHAAAMVVPPAPPKRRSRSDESLPSRGAAYTSGTQTPGP